MYVVAKVTLVTLSQMTQKIKKNKRLVHLGDVELYTETFGTKKKPCLVLIAGAMAPCEFWSDHFCKLAAEHYFVIRYDHRDIGRSSIIDFEKHPYSLKELSEDAAFLLDQFSMDQAHFVGHSMGGYICQHLALEFPERVLSITPISSGPIAKTEIDDIPITEGEKSVLEKTWEVFLAREVGESMEQKIDGFMHVWKYLNGTFEFDETLALAYTKSLLKSPPELIVSGNNHEKIMRHAVEDKRGVIERIDVPTHVIHGNLDPLVLPRFGRAIGAFVKDAWLDVINGMGHMFFNKELEATIFKYIHLFIEQL